MVPSASSLLGFDHRYFSPGKGEMELAGPPCALPAESASCAVCHHLDCTCVGLFLALVVVFARVSAEMLY